MENKNKRNLYVESFGPVSEASIEIRQFNLFIGEQSIGKSTIAKLITIFTDYFLLWAVVAQKRKVWNMVLDSYDLKAYENENTIINYEEQCGEIQINVNIGATVFETSVHKKGNLITEESDVFASIVATKPFFHSDSNEKLSALLNKDGGIMKPAFFNLIRNSLYIPAERIVGTQLTKLLPIINIAKEQIPNNLLRFISELSNSKEIYKTYDAGILNLMYKKQSEDEYVIVGENKKLPLKLASSGIQSTLPLLLVTKYGVDEREYASFVVEEPECNLFPAKQVEILQFLIIQTYAQNRMLTITTHSPYLLSALNNYLYAGVISKGMDKEKLDDLREIISDDLWLDTKKCAIYSLGEDINKGKYCICLLDAETGLIDYNYLDGISLKMGDEFSQLNHLYILNERSKRKKI